jgi:hypothetical protein
LKFNRSFENGSIGGWVMQQLAVIGRSGVGQLGAPLFSRFFAKLVVDVLPAALASLIGGFLFTQYQFGHKSVAQPAAEHATPASAEMLQLVRDEHAMIIDYLKAQAAAEKSRYAAEDKEETRAMVDANPAAVATVVRRVPLAMATAPALPHIKTAVAVTPAPAAVAPPTLALAAAPTATAHSPRFIAQAADSDRAFTVADGPPQSESLLAKTLTIKDHVVHATLHAVSTIGGIPNWIASIGERFSGAANNPSPASHLVSAS